MACVPHPQVLDSCADDSEMRPGSAFIDATNDRTRDSEHSGESSTLTPRLLRFFTNKLGILISQFAPSVRFSEWMPEFLHAIKFVVGVRSQEKVAGIDASPIVARMAHEHIFRNCNPPRKLVSQSVSTAVIAFILSFRNPKHAVAKFHYAASPVPALIFSGLGKFTLKSLAQSFIHFWNVNNYNTVVNLKNTGGRIYGM